MVEDKEFGGFGDAESQSGSYSSKDSKLTYPFLVLEQVRRCAKAGSVEFRGGYEKDIPYASGQAYLHEYVPATHETFSESVITLSNMLSGYFDDTMTAAQNSFDEGVKKEFTYAKNWAKEHSAAFPRSHFFDERASLARVLFGELCKFLKRINFLEGTGVEEGLVDEYN